MPVREKIGLEDLPPDQEIRRFMPLWKAEDLLGKRKTDDHDQYREPFTLYLSQVAELRKLDPRESRLPQVAFQLIQQQSTSDEAKTYLCGLYRCIEEQATRAYASCWFMVGPQALEARMWQKYGGGEEGGIAITSTVRKLTESLSELNERPLLFGIGRVRYIPKNCGCGDFFNLNEYFSAPFLLKLKNHQADQEIRLFLRKALFDFAASAKPGHASYTRVGVNPVQLISSLQLSPLCSDVTRTKIRGALVDCLPKNEKSFRAWLSGLF